MKKGFTLIELLVVISIIGILASLTLVSYSGAQKQTRDTQRKSDLAQLRNGLENYASANNGLYPAGLNNVNALCSVLVSSFISSCVSDPLVPTYNYGFFSSVDGTSYVIYAKLETAGSNNYWEVCSNGKSGKVSGQPNDSTCDIP